MPPLLAAIFSEQVKEYVKQTSRLQENIKRLWALIWGQCSDTIRTRLQALDTYDDMHTASDGLRLLVAIKDLMYNVHEQKYVPLSIHLAKRQFFLLSQGHNTVGEYYEQFKNQTDVLDHIGAGIGDDTPSQSKSCGARASILMTRRKLKKKPPKYRASNGTLPWHS